MLTRPKLSVPDQKGRPRSSSVASSLGFARSGTESLLLGGPLLDLLQALLQRAAQIARGPRALPGRQLHALTFGLGRDHLQDAVPVLVAELAGVELTRERLHELFGH